MQGCVRENGQGRGWGGADKGLKCHGKRIAPGTGWGGRVAGLLHQPAGADGAHTVYSVPSPPRAFRVPGRPSRTTMLGSGVGGHVAACLGGQRPRRAVPCVCPQPPASRPVCVQLTRRESRHLLQLVTTQHTRMHANVPLHACRRSSATGTAIPSTNSQSTRIQMVRGRRPLPAKEAARGVGWGAAWPP